MTQWKTNRNSEVLRTEEVAAQPSVKVEEIATKILEAQGWNEGAEMWDYLWSKTVAILRPYFPADAPRSDTHTPKSCDFPFTDSCTQFEACISANRCLKNLPTVEKAEP